MKVLLISTSLEGGAGGAAYRLYQGLRGKGMNCRVLAQSKHVDDEGVSTAAQNRLAALLRGGTRLVGLENLDRLPLRLFPRRDHTAFSLQWLPDSIAPKAARFAPDVMNLHWICGGWMRIKTLSRLGKPLVWTLHDMWAFTGGCHHSEDCDRYTVSCGACPRLHSTRDWDLSRWVWRRKAKAWKDLDLTVVAPSSWLAECARSSSLLKDVRVEVIPNGLDTKRYKPIDRQVARGLLDLPLDKQLVLFGAWSPNHPWKGFHLLQSALQSLGRSGWKDKIELVVFGLSRPSLNIDMGVKSHYLGRLHDDLSLALAYSAADVMAVPSIRESFGYTASESLACGTPVVAFNANGLKDIVDHEQNGYLAHPFESEGLARGIAWVLEDSHRHLALSRSAREKAERNFALEQYALRYQNLFAEIVEDRRSQLPV